MTDLAAVLAGHHEPGVYVFHPPFDPEDVQRTVEGAGWRFGYVDGWLRVGKVEVLTAIGEALGFPDHYGRNLDALADCLSDLSAVGDRSVLLWDGWGVLARADARTFRIVVELLGERSDAVTTLLRGEGPDISLPALD